MFKLFPVLLFIILYIKMRLDPTSNPDDTTDIARVLMEAQRRVQEQDTAGAIPLFERLVRLLPGHPMPSLSVGTAYLEEKRWEEAVEACQRILTFPNSPLEPGVAQGCSTYHAAACLRLAKAYNEMGQTEEAVKYMEKRQELENAERSSEGSSTGSSEQTGSRRVEALRAQGNQAYREGDYAEAVLSYCEALNIDPSSPELHGNAAQAMHLLGHNAEALPHAEKSIALRPTWTKAYYRKAKILIALDRHREALDSLYRAKSLCQEEAETSGNGSLQDIERLIQEARRSMKEVVRRKQSARNYAYAFAILVISMLIAYFFLGPQMKSIMT